MNESSTTAVKKMTEYIYTHITDKITSGDLARVCGYSRYHASRIFKESTGMYPFEFIRQTRLNRAAIDLQDNSTSHTILDIALDYLFETHEGFTRSFAKQFKTTPSGYRQNPFPARIPIINSIYGGEIMENSNKPSAVFIQIMERPERKLILKRGTSANNYYEYCEEVSCDVWNILTSIKEAIYEPAGIWLPAKLIKDGTSKYVQGVEVPTNFTTEVPEGFDIIDLEPCKLMVFQGEPYDDDDFEQAITDIWDIMQRFDPKLYGYEWADEEAPRFQLEPQGYRGYIEARPVRSVMGTGV